MSNNLNINPSGGEMEAKWKTESGNKKFHIIFNRIITKGSVIVFKYDYDIVAVYNSNGKGNLSFKGSAEAKVPLMSMKVPELVIENIRLAHADWERRT